MEMLKNLNEKLKNAFNVVLQLLGLKATPPPPPLPPSKLEQLLAQYKKIPNIDKENFVKKVILDAWDNISKCLETLGSSTQDVVLTASPVYKAVAEGLQNVAVVVHFLSGAETKHGTNANLESSEQLRALQSLSKLISHLAIPGKAFVKKLEEYLQQYEERLLLTEARGEYKLKISENKEWVKLPLLSFLQSRKSTGDVAEKLLLQFFYDCPHISLVELDSKVPMLPTSLVDIEMLIQNKRVAPLFLREKGEWFLLVVG